MVPELAGTEGQTQCALFLPAIKPAERHAGAAAIAVVLDQQPRADALHAHAAALSSAFSNGTLPSLTKAMVSFRGVASASMTPLWVSRPTGRSMTPSICNLPPAPRVIVTPPPGCDQVPSQSEIFGDAIGATAVSAVLGSQPLADLCAFTW